METEAHKEGWNANIDDKSVWSNPYLGQDGLDWFCGWRSCQKEWDLMPSYQTQPYRK